MQFAKETAVAYQQQLSHNSIKLYIGPIEF